MLGTAVHFAEITVAELPGGSDHGGPHHAVFVRALRPRKAIRSVEPDGEAHLFILTNGACCLRVAGKVYTGHPRFVETPEVQVEQMRCEVVGPDLVTEGLGDVDLCGKAIYVSGQLGL